MAPRHLLLAAALGTVASVVAATDGTPSVAGVAQPQRAQVNWILHCQGCHRPDGSGTPTTAPALVSHVSRFAALPGGREYLGRVPGVTDAALNDAELAELLNWTLQRFDPGNLPRDFEPYSAQEIAVLRRTPLRTDATAHRTAILEQSSRRKLNQR